MPLSGTILRCVAGAHSHTVPNVRRGRLTGRPLDSIITGAGTCRGRYFKDAEILDIFIRA